MMVIENDEREKKRNVKMRANGEDRLREARGDMILLGVLMDSGEYNKCFETHTHKQSSNAVLSRLRVVLCR